MQFLAEDVLQLLVYTVGYTTARIFFPLLSSGRIVVQPPRSKAKICGYRRDRFGRIEIEGESAAVMGSLTFLAVFIACRLLIRAVF